MGAPRYESSYAWLMKAFIAHQLATSKKVVGKKAIAALAMIDQASAKAFEKLPKIDELKKTQETIEAGIEELRRNDPIKESMANRFLQQVPGLKKDLTDITDFRQKQITAYHDIKELQEQYKNQLRSTDPTAEQNAADLLKQIRTKTTAFSDNTEAFIRKFLTVETTLETYKSQVFNELKPEARKSLTPSSDKRLE